MDRKSSLKIYGLLGFPVKHSLSPAMHNAAFKALGIPAEYRLFEVPPEGLEDALLKDIPLKDVQGNIVNSADICGFNITVPHKVRAREILEKNFPDAKEAKLLPFVKLTGAVNTVRRDPVDYINTDASGFAKSLKEDLKFDKKDKNILLIGCGGAGRAVVAGLIWKQGNHPKKIFIYEPNNEAKESAEAHFQQFDISREKMKFILKKEEIPATIKQCQLLVNASPIGMKGEDVSVIDKDLLHDGLSVYDVVYNREKETRLIRDAKEKNLPSQDGLGMLFHQGVLAFEFWRGRRAPEKEMREALMREVKR